MTLPSAASPVSSSLHCSVALAWDLVIVGPGYKVLDVATGTGIAAEAAIKAIGPSGAVVATDLSPAMLEKARGRLSEKLNVSLAVEDGQSLTFPDQHFDAVLCAMGLMLFPDPARGPSEFRRVLREG